MLPHYVSRETSTKAKGDDVAMSKHVSPTFFLRYGATFTYSNLSIRPYWPGYASFSMLVMLITGRLFHVL